MSGSDIQSGAGPLLEVEDVSVFFDDTKALQNVSFNMSAGETRVILGQAGSGKTTLLKSCIGLLRPDSGRIRLFGQDITNMKEQQLFEIRSRVGVLFQEGGLFDSATVGDNVAYPLWNRRNNTATADEIDAKVTESLKFVELAHTIEQFPSELSGGMRRRVGIARAVVTDPPLVFYDSPTAGLDPITANTIMALIAKERDSQNTANLIVTTRYQDGQLMSNFRYNRTNGHLEPVSENGAGVNGSNPTRTTFMVMREGHLVFEGSQAELESSTDDYISKFVVKFS